MSRQRRVRWATWPGALGLGALALLMGGPGIVALTATAVLPADDSAGVDFAVSGPGWPVRVAALVVAVAALMLPVLTVRWARRKWAGYVLLGLGLSAVVGVVGLFLVGIL